MLTRDQIQQALPVTLKINATQEFTDKVNNIVSDPLIAERVRENFISYSYVLKDGRFKTEDYLHAVLYVSYKLMGMSNVESYQRTFPNRYADLVAKGASGKDISAYVTAYHKGKLVTSIIEQSVVPVWVLNQDVAQGAINKLADLMHNAASEKVQSDSAIALLNHLKKPDIAKVELDVGIKENSGMNELKDALVRLAEKQVQVLEEGVPLKTVTDSRIIEGESKHVAD